MVARGDVYDVLRVAPVPCELSRSWNRQSVELELLASLLVSWEDPRDSRFELFGAIGSNLNEDRRRVLDVDATCDQLVLCRFLLA